MTVVISKFRDNISQIKEIPFKLMSLPGFEYFYEEFTAYSSSSRFKISSRNRISLDTGKTMLYSIEDSILRSLDIFEDLIEAFRFEEWHEITIFPTKPHSGYMKINRNYTQGLRYLELFS